MNDLANKILLCKTKNKKTLDNKAIFANFTKAVFSIVSGNVLAVPGNLADMLKAVNEKQTVNQLAWTLVYQSLIISITAITRDNLCKSKSEPTEEIGRLGVLIAKCLDDGEFYIDKAFLENPKSLSAIKPIQEKFTTWLISAGCVDAAAVAQNLGDMFIKALNQYWGDNPEELSRITKTLQTPFSAASEVIEGWKDYREQLGELIKEKLYDNKFSLSDIYIKPRAYNKDNSVVNIHDELVDWARSSTNNDSVRVISGPPGMGKSTLVKMLAAEWKVNLPYNFLYIPLYQLNMSDNIVNVIGNFLENNASSLKKNPLALQSCEQRLLIIFDGLDELSCQSVTDAECVKNFVAQALRLVVSHNKQKNNDKIFQRRVLITGRDFAVDSCQKLFENIGQIFRLLPLVIDETSAKELTFTETCPNVDLRPLWWQKYGAATDQHYHDIPTQFKTQNLNQITGLPLLNYLVAISVENKVADFTAEATVNTIYEHLFRAVYQREYDALYRTNQITSTKDLFFRAMEEFAIAIWHGQGFTATIEEIEKRCKTVDTQHSSPVVEVIRKNETDVSKLLLNFYFRQSNNDKNRQTVEFTHKSFAEYLISRYLVALLKSITSQVGDGNLTEEEALIEWIKITGPSELNDNIYDFLEREIRQQKDQDENKAMQKMTINLIELITLKGMPMEKIGIKKYATMKKQARNAEEALLVLHYACANVTQNIIPIKTLIPTAFGEWFRQLQGQVSRQDYQHKLCLHTLGWLDLSKTILDFVDFYMANLSNSVLTEASLTSTTLLDANACNADLSSANLDSADLRNGKFEKAKFHNTILTYAHLDDIKLDHADLEYIDLSGSSLINSSLKHANLTRANLAHSTMYKANLEDACLNDARMTNINLENACLKDARFIEARLDDTSLEKSDLTNANFENASLRRTQFAGAIMKDVNLAGAKLQKKQLSALQLAQICKAPDFFIPDDEDDDENSDVISDHSKQRQKERTKAKREHSAQNLIN